MAIEAEGDIKISQIRDGLINPNFTNPSYVSASSLSVDGDVTSWLRQGRGVVINFEEAGVKRGIVDTLSYDSETNKTTIIMVGDSLVEEEITSILLSLSDGEGLYTMSAKKSFKLYLPFEEGSGIKTEDLSGLGNYGLINGAAWNDGGRVGKCLSFDGDNDYVECGRNGNLDITDKITLEAWVKKSELNRIESIISKGSYGLKIGEDDKPYIELISGSENIVDCGQLGSNARVYSLAVYDGKLYGGTYNSGRVYRYDGGTTWTDCGQLGSNTLVYSLAVYDGKLYVGTYNSGRVYTIGSGVAAYSETALTTTNYAHVVGTYDGETARIYVDTVKTEKEGSVTIGTNFFNLLIGCSMGSSKGGYSGSGEDYFKGLIDEVRIYSRVLSDAEIQNHYQNP